MLKYVLFVSIVRAGNVAACLLVEPLPGSLRSPTIRRASPCSIRWGLNIASTSRDAGGVVRQSHGGTAHEEHVGHDAPEGKTFA